MIEWSKLAINSLQDLKLKLPDNHLDIEDGDKPTMADTVGSLIDKLAIVNIKMFWNQEILYEIRRMTPDQFVAKYGNDLERVHKIIKVACDMNVLRSQLIDEINMRMADMVQVLGGTQNDIETLRLVAPSHKSY
jgi:nitrogen regulatory protein PII-like uncharacterized protein